MGSKQRSVEYDKLLELKRQLELESGEKVKIKQMTYLKGVDLILNNSEQAILVEKELENKQLEYELYKVGEEDFTKIAEYDREKNELILTEEYIREELEKARIDQDIEVRITPEEIVNKAKEIEELEEVKEVTSKESEPELEEDEVDQDEIVTAAIQDDLGIEISKCYKIEDENYAQDVLGRETGEDHYIVVEKGTGRNIAISGNQKSGFHENKELNSSRGGGEAATQNSSQVIKDKNGKSVMAIDNKSGNIYVLEENEEGKIEPRRLDSRPMTVAEKEKYIEEVQRDDDDELTIYPGERVKYY